MACNDIQANVPGLASLSCARGRSPEGTLACVWAAARGRACLDGTDPAGGRAGSGRYGRAGMNVGQVHGSPISC